MPKYTRDKDTRPVVVDWWEVGEGGAGRETQVLVGTQDWYLIGNLRAHCMRAHVHTHLQTCVHARAHTLTRTEAALLHTTRYNTLQHTATHCSTLQHTATHCTTRNTATHWNTLRFSSHRPCVSGELPSSQKNPRTNTKKHTTDLVVQVCFSPLFSNDRLVQMNCFFLICVSVPSGIRIRV